MQQRYDADDRPLELRSIEEAPHDRSNRIAEPSEKREQKRKGKSLDRSYDHADLAFLNPQAGTKRKSREGVDEGLDLLRVPRATGDMVMENAAHSTLFRKRQRRGADLSFLAPY